MKLEFKAINITEHRDLVVKFRADSFFTSFGHDRDFWGEDGQGDKRYLDILAKKLTPENLLAFHVWQNNQIIGQMELDFYFGDKNIGYINLFYLIPEVRGSGVSHQLDQFATDFFKKLKVPKMLLSVSPTNPRAIAYYKKNGWTDLGPRFSQEELEKNKFPQVHLMEKLIS